MKPETQSSHLSSELPSVQYDANVEIESRLVNPEKGVEIGAERYEQSAENNAVVSDIGLSASLPAPVIGDTISAKSDVTIGDTPVVAADDDLIEKEWVDKAKKIVADTKDNPYQRDEAVNKLQIDYLKKRYGRELGVDE